MQVDGVPYATTNCACLSSGSGGCGSTAGFWSGNPTGFQPWNRCAPFDRKFHIILNLAVGGGWPGNPTPDTVFPQHFIIDYVRVTAL